MGRAGRSKLEKIVEQLARRFGPPQEPITSNPFELIVLESVAYLASDERREAAFNLLRKTVGVKPHKILAASNEELLHVTKQGGIGAEMRATRLREIALIATTEFGGDLRNALKLPLQKAKQALRKFPSIGEPGAEKILLFTRTEPVLALDSNGLRVLLRLGFGEEKKNYSASYASVRDATANEVVRDYNWLTRAHLLLREHGKVLCKTTKPKCEMCPVRGSCAYFAHLQLKSGRSVA
jgi:endonuclease III